MKRSRGTLLAIGLSMLFMGQAAAPAPPATVPASNGPATAELSPQIRALLQMLHDRRNTLNNFTAKADYSVYHPVTDDAGGKRGDVDFIFDGASGPVFSIDFTERTDEKGKVVGKGDMEHQQIIFDGSNVLVKDFGPKQYIKTRMLDEGGKPGDATSLNGKVTIPIGIDPDEVVKCFNITIVPNPDPDKAVATTMPAPPSPVEAADANRTTVHLVPKPGNHFDFKEMDITIDKKLELPVQMVQEAKSGDITTIKLSAIEVNTGKAKVIDTKIPEGWTERAASGAPAAPASSPVRLP